MLKGTHNWIFFLASITLSTPLAAKDLIRMADGSTADSCERYMMLRKKTAVAEDVANRSIAAQYLGCSSGWGGRPLEASDPVAAIAGLLKVSQLRTSLGPRAGDDDTFLTLGANVDLSKHEILFADSGQHVTVSFRQRKGDEYLVWVVDEILDAGYRSYYPAIVSHTSGGVSVRPFYDSGY